MIFGTNMSWSVYIGNKKKDILILDKGLTDRFDDTTSTAEKKYSINFTEHKKKSCLSLNYDESNSYILVNGIEIY